MTLPKPISFASFLPRKPTVLPHAGLHENVQGELCCRK